MDIGQSSWPKFLVRLPPDVKRWLTEQAMRNSASQNSEIIRCVRERMDRIAASEARRMTVAKQTA